MVWAPQETSQGYLNQRSSLSLGLHFVYFGCDDIYPKMRLSHRSICVVCCTEPSGKSCLETVWKRAGTFKKHLAGDWIGLEHLFHGEKPSVSFFALLSMFQYN